MNPVTTIVVVLVAIASIALGLFAAFRAGLFADRGREDSARAKRVSWIAVASGVAMIVSVDILANTLFPLDF